MYTMAISQAQYNNVLISLFRNNGDMLDKLINFNFAKDVDAYITAMLKKAEGRVTPKILKPVKLYYQAFDAEFARIFPKEEENTSNSRFFWEKYSYDLWFIITIHRRVIVELEKKGIFRTDYNNSLEDDIIFERKNTNFIMDN